MYKSKEHIQKFYKKRLYQISHSLRKHFGLVRHNQYVIESKSLEQLSKEHFDAGHF